VVYGLTVQACSSSVVQRLRSRFPRCARLKLWLWENRVLCRAYCAAAARAGAGPRVPVREQSASRGPGADARDREPPREQDGATSREGPRESAGGTFRERGQQKGIITLNQ
jgi:hypothetical protein